MEAHQFKAYVISNIMEGVFFISATDSLFSIKAVRLIRNCLLQMMKYVKSFVAWPIFPEAVAGSTLQKSSKFRGKHSCWRLVFNRVIDLGL